MKAAARGIVGCYNEMAPQSHVFAAERNIPVLWGHGSVLEVDFVCLREIRQRTNR